MARTKDIRIRFSKTESDQITNDACASGFETISSYLRNLAVTQRNFLNARIIETHKISIQTNKKVEKILEMLESSKL